MTALLRLGGPLLLALRSLRQHALSTCVTVLSVALGSGLVMAVFSINHQAYQAFVGAPVGFDAVLGARGSPLQLVLNAVFHLETSPGNLPWKTYLDARDNPQIELAIPYALGDNFLGFRIVGTTADLFGKYRDGAGRGFHIRTGGRVFDEFLREAVIGSYVAEKLRLNVGSTFSPVHGLYFDPDHPEDCEHHHEEFVVVGVLEPTSSPADRVIWVPIAAKWRMEGHVLRGAGIEYVPQPGVPIPDEHKEVSAVLLKFRSPQAGMALDNEFNKRGKVATLAWPIANVMADLFKRMGWANLVLQAVAYLVVVVAAAAILAAVYNSINERRRDFAILRALGARRSIVFSSIVLETTTIALVGALLGYAVYAGIVATAAGIVWRQTGVVLEVLAPHPILYLAPLGMLALGALAGLLPAFKAYSVDVASNITPTS